MSLYYIGGFPPPYGGVTIKNQNLFIALKEKIDIKRIDFNEIKRKNIKQTLNLFFSLLNRRNQFVVGVAGKKTRKNLCKLMYFVNRKAMEKSIIFLMGGTAANDIINDEEYQKYVTHFKCIYAETHGMVELLRIAGLKNAEYYPNCRFKTEKKLSVKEDSSPKIRYGFISLISKDNWVNTILDFASRNPSLSFSFYGPIEKEYKYEFLSTIKKLNNTSYYGVFSGNSEELYEELSRFEILFLKTDINIEETSRDLVKSKQTDLLCFFRNNGHYLNNNRQGQEGAIIRSKTSEEFLKLLEEIENNYSKDLGIKDVIQKKEYQSSETSLLAKKIEQENGLILNKTYVMQTVFFSRVCLDKGIDIVLKTAQLMPDVAFHIYGPIDEDSLDLFYDTICKLDNVFYHGIFSDKNELLYKELSKYEVVLLPTRWASEGVPGILVEAKIVGIPAIVSNICFNSEIIHDEVDGIVLKDNNEICLSEKIRNLIKNKQLYRTIKNGSKGDAESYYVEAYIDSIINQINS